MSEEIDLNQSFKAYDVRGIVGESLTAEAVEAIGAAFVDVLSLGGETVLVGGDMRPSSAEFSQAFARGATYRGANVVMLGIARRAGNPITFWEFTRKGIVVTAVSVALAAPYLWLRYFVFG